MDNTESLARAFTKAQEITASDAKTIAEEVLAADADIAAAARKWAESGKMPMTPAIEGMTPASLNAEYRPTQVFTILIGLRRFPDHAKSMLKFFGKGGHSRSSGKPVGGSPTESANP